MSYRTVRNDYLGVLDRASMLIKAGCASTPHLLVVVPVKRRAGLRLRLVVFPARARSAVVRLLKQKVHLIAAREVSNNEGVGEHVRMDGPMEGGGSRGWPSLGRVNPQSRQAASLARLLLLLWLYSCCCVLQLGPGHVHGAKWCDQGRAQGWNQRRRPCCSPSFTPFGVKSVRKDGEAVRRANAFE